ncbi:MAG TPA: hypothetical protein VM865_03590 [Acidobacteriaceae bacterium]|jgi:hypothetical protein|nr:hypothetical protein [Acidobacteriaceae bacterium]
MNLHVLLVTHTLPLWFLVLSLFLPRVCLAIAWLQNSLAPFHLQGLIPLIVAIAVPRILILLLIYQDQGIGLWFLLHLVALVIAWGGGGTQVVRRRRVIEVEG